MKDLKRRFTKLVQSLQTGSRDVNEPGNLLDSTVKLERIYCRLLKNGFLKGDDLENLACMLLFSALPESDLIARCCLIKEAFCNRHISMNADYYEALGLYILLGLNVKEVDAVVDEMAYMAKKNHLAAGHKYMTLILAALTIEHTIFNENQTVDRLCNALAMYLLNKMMKEENYAMSCCNMV